MKESRNRLLNLESTYSTQLGWHVSEVCETYYPRSKLRYFYNSDSAKAYFVSLYPELCSLHLHATSPLFHFSEDKVG